MDEDDAIAVVEEDPGLGEVFRVVWAETAPLEPVEGDPVDPDTT